MQQKPADELLGAERHDFAGGILPIIFPVKADTAVLEFDQPAVGDRHPMGVAAEIGEHLLSTAEWSFGVYHPIPGAQRGQMLLERYGLSERCQRCEELQTAGFEGGGDLLEQE